MFSFLLFSSSRSHGAYLARKGKFESYHEKRWRSGFSIWIGYSIGVIFTD
jgi:hypothetical protein